MKIMQYDWKLQKKLTLMWDGFVGCCFLGQEYTLKLICEIHFGALQWQKHKFQIAASVICFMHALSLLDWWVLTGSGCLN